MPGAATAPALLAAGAHSRQWTLGGIVTAVAAAGNPEPFWQPDGIATAAWGGQLIMKSFALLARRRYEQAASRC